MVSDGKSSSSPMSTIASSTGRQVQMLGPFRCRISRNLMSLSTPWSVFVFGRASIKLRKTWIETGLNAVGIKWFTALVNLFWKHIDGFHPVRGMSRLFCRTSFLTNPLTILRSQTLLRNLNIPDDRFLVVLKADPLYGSRSTQPKHTSCQVNLIL